MSDSYILHYGVKGQKWGIRKSRTTFKEWSKTNWKDATKKQKIAAVGAGIGLGLGASFLLASGVAPNTAIGKLSTSVIESGRNYVSNLIGSARTPQNYITRNGQNYQIRQLQSGQRIPIPDIRK